MIINTEVATADISASLGKESSNQFSYASFFNLRVFAETLELNAPIIGPPQEEATAPVILDSVGINVLYHSVIQR